MFYGTSHRKARLIFKNERGVASLWLGVLTDGNGRR